MDKSTDQRSINNLVWEHISCPILWLSTDYKIKDINSSALKIYQWQKKDIINENYLDLCKQNNLPCPILNNNFSPSKQIIDIETIIKTKNQTSTVLWNIECSYDNEKPNGFILIGKDITELKLKDDKIFELDSIVACMPNNVYWYDKNHTYLGCNHNSAKSIGLPREEAIGKNTKELAEIGKLPPDMYYHGFVKYDEQVMKTGISQFNIEEPPFQDATGKTKYFLSNKVPLRDKNNNIVGLVGISTDITELKTMEQKLEQARKLQEKSQNAKIQGMMEIAAGIAHEIRTPLTSIQCATDAKAYMDRLIAGYKMAEDAGLPVESIRPSHMEGLKNIFNSIDAEAKESMQIIDMFLNNLKSMVKEANTGDYQLCSIKDAVSGALDRYPFDEIQKNSVVYTDADDFKFYGVNLLIQHIIFNLMKNALYYLSENPKAFINIRHEQGETDNYLYFKDTGPGISEYGAVEIRTNYIVN